MLLNEIYWNVCRYNAIKNLLYYLVSEFNQNIIDMTHSWSCITPEAYPTPFIIKGIYFCILQYNNKYCNEKNRNNFKISFACDWLDIKVFIFFNLKLFLPFSLQYFLLYIVIYKNVSLLLKRG